MTSNSMRNLLVRCSLQCWCWTPAVVLMNTIVSLDGSTDLATCDATAGLVSLPSAGLEADSDTEILFQTGFKQFEVRAESVAAAGERIKQKKKKMQTSANDPASSDAKSSQVQSTVRAGADLHVSKAQDLAVDTHIRMSNGKTVVSPAPPPLQLVGTPIDMLDRKSILNKTSLPSCISDPFSSFEGAVVAMFTCMTGMCVLLWALTVYAAPQVAEVTDLDVPLVENRPVPKAPVKKATVVHALDGLRTIFIANIILSHQNFYHMIPDAFQIFHHFAAPSLHFFNMLSGFVLLHSSADVHERFNLKASAAFIARRIVRICPGYFAALALYAGIAYALPEKRYPLVAWPLQALFMQTIVAANVCDRTIEDSYIPFGGNGVGWFASVVLLSSCFFPLLYNVKPTSGISATTLLIAMAGFSGLLHHRIDGTAGTDFKIVGMSANHFWPFWLPGFAAGMLAAEVSRHLSPEALSWRGWGWIFDMCIVSMMAIVHFRHGGMCGGLWMLAETFVWVLMMITARCAVEGAEHGGSPHSGLLGHLLAAWPLSSLGKYSFGAYIYQWPAWFCIRQIFEVLRIPSDHSLDILRVVSVVLMAWTLAWLSEHVLEAPVRRHIERRL
eukprot:gnl/TRDRNA2_/TRDRNA2_174319_c0_seq19.p1 gnl/TRDRNA2_/TRDRNA2_174319_c0~~gnl/TRDRNA2_/TRDRNA2_174319_c0_seq19.p1  ORF type:complete len:613 (-),score=68.63 gnl/TRDRNA2_/TRDRNA2_174319_c0_seq19:48-1886(-)